MKYILQLPIFILMLWASRAGYATYRLALSDRNIEADITIVSVGVTTHWMIDLISCKYALKMLNVWNRSHRLQSSGFEK